MHEPALLQYEWPGNVRELRNVLERAAILCEGAPIDASHLRLQSGAEVIRDDTTDLSVVERTTIAKVLHDCRGNKTKAARRLGLTRTQLHCGFEGTDSRKLPPRNRPAATTTEDAMTNEDNTADVRNSNWTLATGTKPGAREVCSLFLEPRV